MANADNDLPTYESLAGLAPSIYYGLLVLGADAALNATYEFSWQKEHALLGTLNEALIAAARCVSAIEAPKPRWLDGVIARELRAVSTSGWARERFVRIRLLRKVVTYQRMNWEPE